MQRKEGAMSKSTIETLVQRLDRLERENRRLKRIGGSMLGGITVALMMRQSQCNISVLGEKVIEAQKFIIRDGSGKSRAELTEMGLTFTDAEGHTLVSLGVSRRTAQPRYEFVHFRLFGGKG